MVEKRISDEIFEDIRNIAPHKSCCQKAYLCGLLYNCRRNTDGKGFTAFFRRREEAQRAAEIINTRFFCETDTSLTPSSRGGHKGFGVAFYSKALAKFFNDVDEKKSDSIQELLGFRCPRCEASFMRGVFLSCASVSQPKDGYRLEFSFENDRRSLAVARLLERSVSAAGRTKRGERYILYYRSNVKIADFFYYVEALNAGFMIADVSIERNMRNIANRATNCVTHNISRSVNASKKQIDAVNYIIEKEKTALLDDDLRATAYMRIENPDASLSELAAMHEPPITKSGVNGRLAKIIRIAEELKNQ